MRVLYVSQTGMTEPLGRSQVIPYLQGLARAGFEIEVVATEPEGTAPAAVESVRALLDGNGIAYAAATRSASHGMAVKAREWVAAFAWLLVRALGRRPHIIHARATLPAAVAQPVSSLLPRTRLLFDCRGLVADEYADFGYWDRRSTRYRLFKLAERHLFARSDAMVVLTERMRRWLRDERRIPERTPIEVIPCCVDLQRFALSDERRAQARGELGAGDRFVLAYAGNLNAWYCDEEMAELFAALRRRRPALFAVYTRSPTEKLRAALARRGVSEADVRFAAVAPDDMPARLAAADAAVSFAEARFSKIASSPVKVAEYLAVGLPVVVNRGVGDQDALIASHPRLLVDAGRLSPRDLDRAAALLAALPDDERRQEARALAVERFGLETVGVARYKRLYERLAG